MSVDHSCYSRHALLVAGLIVTLLGTGCSATREPAKSAAEPEPVTQPAVEIESMPRYEPVPVEAVRRDAPISYTVKKGDTLWDIASRFLHDPWYWPEIWYVNPQVKNPHRIYPGDVLSIHWVGGKPLIKLEPRVRVEPLGEEQQSIPAAAIDPFLMRPRVVSEEDLQKAPYVLGAGERRLIYGAGDNVYVRGLPQDSLIGAPYLIFRPGKTLKDPQTGEVLGYQILEVGDSEVVRKSEPASMLLTSTTREVLAGDRLLNNRINDDDLDFYPKAPAKPIESTIIGLFDAISQVARYQSVVINRGEREGVQRGDVLVINAAGRSLKDPIAKNETVQLPEERVGLLMIFRTYEKVSYGLIMESERPVREGDSVRNP